MTNEPDLVILLVASYGALINRLLAEMKKAGIRGIRATHGFVIRAVAAEEPGISRLAVLLDTSKQAASRLADTMVKGGFLARYSEPGDRRRVWLRLTP